MVNNRQPMSGQSNNSQSGQRGAVSGESNLRDENRSSHGGKSHAEPDHESATDEHPDVLRSGLQNDTNEDDEVACTRRMIR
jgi:hypothetical protein